MKHARAGHVRINQGPIGSIALLVLLGVPPAVQPPGLPREQSAGEMALLDKLVRVEKQFWTGIQARNAALALKTAAKDSLFIPEDGTMSLEKLIEEASRGSFSLEQDPRQSYRA